MMRAVQKAGALLLAVVSLPLADSFHSPGMAAGLRLRRHTALRRCSLQATPRMQGEGSVESGIPGTWCLTTTIEDEKTGTFFITLNPDRTVTFPPGEEVERDSRVRWKYAEGEPGSSQASQFALEAPKRSTLSTAFSDRSFQGQYQTDTRTVSGTVMDGEDEPEYVGKFEFKQIAPAAASSGVKAPFPTEVDDWDGEVDESAWFD